VSTTATTSFAKLPAFRAEGEQVYPSSEVIYPALQSQDMVCT